MATEIIVTSREELTNIIEAVMEKIEAKKKQGVGEKLYYIANVARILGKSHSKIKKLAQAGIIRTTKDGLIPESAIKEYLDQNP